MDMMYIVEKKCQTWAVRMRVFIILAFHVEWELRFSELGPLNFYFEVRCLSEIKTEINLTCYS